MPRAVEVGCVIGALGSGALALAGVVEGLCPTCEGDAAGCEPAQPAPPASRPPSPPPGVPSSSRASSSTQLVAGQGGKGWRCPASCAAGLVGALTETQALELRQGG